MIRVLKLKSDNLLCIQLIPPKGASSKHIEGQPDKQVNLQLSLTRRTKIRQQCSNMKKRSFTGIQENTFCQDKNNQPASTWAYASNLPLACTFFAGCNIGKMDHIHSENDTVYSRSSDSETYFTVRSVSYEKYNPGIASSDCNRVLKYASSLF